MKSNFISLIIGAGIGSLITYIILKEKYEMRLQTEIDSVKEVYSNRREVIIDDISMEFPTQDEDKDKDDIVDKLYEIYPKIIKKQKYFLSPRLKSFISITPFNPASAAQSLSKKLAQIFIRPRCKSRFFSSLLLFVLKSNYNHPRY